ncbi:response regulator transcription factor [Jiulongibacter sediminis]|uniref:Transcriptional regulator n=1 Tax=Jiulongibacter sediminis TaxID=1605367 RepID=A0A0P7C8E9_9BACT|nr:response regulator transcription factor [Jiulongibacter sediminis]KPM48797.1 transcriptional regulator [Jiulongibacter sediminis]TBX25329.1 transcriptional regulator [Jiulongibacter sediminis]
MLKVLYLEDEPSLAKIVVETLQSRGMEILHLKTGERALETVQVFHPDVCVFDVMLPGKDGFETGVQFRGAGVETPILFLTAKSLTEDVLKGFKSGGNDYLKKPFSLEELIVRIENLHHLHSREEEAFKRPPEIKLGDFTFDPKKQIIQGPEKVQSLSFRETQLLLMLASKKGEIVSRKDILDTIWGDDHFFNSRNLDVYITRLRGYFKSSDSVQIITLKGVGYRLCTD